MGRLGSQCAAHTTRACGSASLVSPHHASLSDKTVVSRVEKYHHDRTEGNGSAAKPIQASKVATCDELWDSMLVGYRIIRRWTSTTT